MTRAFSYLLIILGLYLLGHAAYQECTGDTIRPYFYLPFSRDAILDRRHNNAYLFHIHVLKKNNPERFRQFMEAHWLWAALIFAGGVVLNATEYREPTPDTSD